MERYQTGALKPAEFNFLSVFGRDLSGHWISLQCCEIEEEE